jgi:hypothetical protein
MNLFEKLRFFFGSGASGEGTFQSRALERAGYFFIARSGLLDLTVGTKVRNTFESKT